MTLDASVREPGLATLVCTKQQSFVQNYKDVFHSEDWEVDVCSQWRLSVQATAR